MTACKRGHEAPRRYANGSCVLCQRGHSARWRRLNPEKVRLSQQKWDAKNKARRALHLRRAALKKYGLTVEGYDVLLQAQHGVCAICLQPPTPGRALAVDHDHATGRVRCLACSRCNRSFIGSHTVATARRLLAILVSR